MMQSDGGGGSVAMDSEALLAAAKQSRKIIDWMDDLASKLPDSLDAGVAQNDIMKILSRAAAGAAVIAGIAAKHESALTAAAHDAEQQEDETLTALNDTYDALVPKRG